MIWQTRFLFDFRLWMSHVYLNKHRTKEKNSLMCKKKIKSYVIFMVEKWIEPTFSLYDTIKGRSESKKDGQCNAHKTYSYTRMALSVDDIDGGL